MASKIVIAVGVGFALYIGQQLLMLQVGHAVARRWEEDFGYPPADRALRRTPGATAGLAALSSACETASQAAKLTLEQQRRPTLPDGVLQGETELTRRVAFLHCLATSAPERLNDQAHRAHLVFAVEDYLKLIDKVREERSMAGWGPDQLPFTAVVAGWPSHGMDPIVVSDLRGLTKAGTLTIDDFGLFGWGVRPELKAALRPPKPASAT